MKMKKLFAFVLVALFAGLFLESCNKQESYADKKKKENAAINAYIAKNKVRVISEETFAANGYKTDVSKNEFVLFRSNGIYLQIVRQGCGEKLKNGESADVLCRFTERNLLTDSLQLSNDILYYSSTPEKFYVVNNYGTFNGSFDTSSSLMYQAYTKPSVPSGWLFPLTYINLGRPVKDDDEVAKINVIVPSAQGQYYATMNTYPCLYNLTYQRGK
jgi:hypothetical protein